MSVALLLGLKSELNECPVSFPLRFQPNPKMNKEPLCSVGAGVKIVYYTYSSVSNNCPGRLGFQRVKVAGKPPY